MTIDELKALLADVGDVEVARTPSGCIVSAECASIEAARMLAYAVIDRTRFAHIAGPPGVVGRGTCAYFEVELLCDIAESVATPEPEPERLS